MTACHVPGLGPSRGTDSGDNILMLCVKPRTQAGEMLAGGHDEVGIGMIPPPKTALAGKLCRELLMSLPTCTWSNDEILKASEGKTVAPRTTRGSAGPVTTMTTPLAGSGRERTRADSAVDFRSPHSEVSQITLAGQGYDSHFRLPVRRKVIYPSLFRPSARRLVFLRPPLSISIAGYTMDVEQAITTFQESPVPHKDFGFLVVPKRLRLVFGSASALIQMSIDFQVSYAEVSQVPTMYQVGYCIGLFFISPLGDLLRRLGLALSKSLLVFRTFAFLIGVFNVTPQILVPFAADLASPGQHGAAVSTLQAGIMVGILLARVFAGVVAYFFSWRLVYYISIGIQVLVLCGTYLLIPDQPCRNPNLTYYEIFYTMAKYLVEPRLMQVMLVNVASIACWSSFWVTLTFLLGSPPYQYSTLYIGLFGLIGVVGVLGGPLFGRLSETARSRLNAILTLSLSAGQALGTSAGSKVFLTYGWRAASALSMAFYGWQLLILLLRGPNCKQSTWFGYEGGFRHQVEQKQTGSATPATQTSSMVERENIQTLQT
ncbi:major facilitator superfamily domain-containing protein [Boletus edulis BED1]|uniref:Major facilitator superfamily domain-containing protein n=1 Tax=Boletus edulis BED1 TaxID=1328754 RepID=A0AAD4BVC2_BOLED|nr:major facilitator superfamily domain-containing protein [Boletus edulis BED1]